ncbi:MAG: hypothetical protein EB053_04690 [Chlamydiae bacterium]|jgi:hypothetical protein|nr:hypothetical protein [Chlamydiota bacterium]
MTVNLARDVVVCAQMFDNHVQDHIQDKQRELDEISQKLSNDAKLLRKLRDHQDSKKDVDLTPIRADIEQFKEQFIEVQNSLQEGLKSSFDFDKLKYDKIDRDTLQDLIEEVEASKTYLQNRVQPTIMEIETKIQLMKLLSEICKHMLSQQSDSIKNWINRGSR